MRWIRSQIWKMCAKNALEVLPFKVTEKETIHLFIISACSNVQSACKRVIMSIMQSLSGFASRALDSCPAVRPFMASDDETIPPADEKTGFVRDYELSSHDIHCLPIVCSVNVILRAEAKIMPCIFQGSEMFFFFENSPTFNSTENFEFVCI